MADQPRRKPPSKPPKPRRRWIRLLLVPLVVILAVGVLAAGVSAFWVLTILPRSLPSVSQLESFEPSVGSKIYDENDEQITESHFGVDPIGIARAVYQNFRRGRIVEGGSTITQQLAKVLFLTPDKSLERKLKEAVLALELERRYSKDRILEMYLNQIYFGHGAFGVEAAARTFFGKGVSELTPAECVVDAGMLKPAQAKQIAGATIGLVPPERRRTTGQYYLEYVQQYLEAQFGADLVFKGGLHVYTTLSPTLQLKAESSLRDGLRALETRRASSAGKDAPPPERPEGALLAIEPQTGYIRAMVGGYDFFKSEFNRAVQARRQPGSAFKPFVYMAALEAGQTPASVVDDSPIQYPLAGGKIWKPDNYDRKFRGPITYQQALEESINVAAIRVQERTGIRRTVDIARRLGVDSPLHENLSIALGTSDLTLLELTSAYGSLANQGTWVSSRSVRSDVPSAME